MQLKLLRLPLHLPPSSNFELHQKQLRLRLLRRLPNHLQKLLMRLRRLRKPKQLHRPTNHWKQRMKLRLLRLKLLQMKLLQLMLLKLRLLLMFLLRLLRLLRLLLRRSRRLRLLLKLRLPRH